MGSVFQAMDKSVYSMLNSICRQLLALIPAAYLLSLLGDINLVWLSYPIAEVVALLMTIIMMTIIMMISVYRKKIKPLYNSSCNL